MVPTRSSGPARCMLDVTLSGWTLTVTRNRGWGTRVDLDVAPVAQGIEHSPPERGAQVRILPGAHTTWAHVGLPEAAALWTASFSFTICLPCRYAGDVTNRRASKLRGGGRGGRRLLPRRSWWLVSDAPSPYRDRPCRGTDRRDCSRVPPPDDGLPGAGTRRELVGSARSLRRCFRRCARREQGCSTRRSSRRRRPQPTPCRTRPASERGPGPHLHALKPASPLRFRPA